MTSTLAQRLTAHVVVGLFRNATCGCVEEASTLRPQWKRLVGEGTEVERRGNEKRHSRSDGTSLEVALTKLPGRGSLASPGTTRLTAARLVSLGSERTGSPPARDHTVRLHSFFHAPPLDRRNFPPHSLSRSSLPCLRTSALSRHHKHGKNSLFSFGPHSLFLTFLPLR